MKQNTLNKKILYATKWSTIGEVIAKLIIPITNMVLARVLAPEAFGVVATISMVVSFADMFTDAGFSKYLIQHEFKNEEELSQFTNVAFWTNIVISVLLWGVIIIFSEKIAFLVGNKGLGNVIAISCIQLPLTSFSSIQTSLYRRKLNFKPLFLVRIINVLVPFVITIPLALNGWSYWALISGNIICALISAIILTIKSEWKPKVYYNLVQFKNMVNFSIWSFMEQFSIWLTMWIDTFIIGSMLNEYYLGIYRTSINTVNTLFALIIASTTPVLFSALSRVQNDQKQFENIFYKMQGYVSYLIFPMGVGMFVFSDLIVKILLGDNWGEANSIISIWAIVSTLTIVVGNYSSEVYRSKGKPKISFWLQIIHLAFLIPTCIFSVRLSFLSFVFIRTLVRLQSIIADIICLNKIFKISIKNMFKNISIQILSSILMGIEGIILLNMNKSFLWSLISILICLITYVMILMVFKKSRKDLESLYMKIVNKN